MLIPLISLFLIISDVFSFQQNDYFLTFQRFEAVSYNHDYLRTARVTTYKYNRTQAVVNATFDFLKDIGNDLDIVVQAYVFASNEYRLFPLHMKIDLCGAIKANDFGLASTIQKGHFDGCPINKGPLNVYNWKPDESKFPPHIPNGNYKIDLQLKHFSEDVGLVEGYGIVSRPLGRRH